MVFLWFIRTFKAILFWFYLWQLKEYHLGRFLDHFRTEKGKGLLLNKISLFKIVLIPVFFILPVFVFFVLFFIYIGEFIKTLLDFLRKKLKKPVLTKKTLLLIFTGLLAEILFIFILSGYTQDVLLIAFWLLIFDVSTPLIASIIVFLFQPIAILSRNRIIKKAKAKREKFKDLLVIGVTGSYGKTSTKEFLAAILAEKYKVLKTKEHQNSEIGVSLCILDDLKPEHEIFICEMGAYNRGGIKLLCDIAKPKIGILTGINEQHMATFGSQENIIKAKYELIESLPDTGIAFFNAQNKYCLELYEKTKIKKFLYAKEAGSAWEENVAGAKAVAEELGMTVGEIKEEARAKEGIYGLKIIDSSYSANPDGVMADLDYLAKMSGRKIIIMPCLIELGSSSKEVHQRIGKKIAQVCDLAIITTKERFKEIKQGAPNALFMENPKEILEKIKSLTKEGDVVLLESRVPNQLIKSLLK